MFNLVREHINEKFTQDSDPIHDMGIGIYTKRNFNDERKFFKFLIEVMPVIIKTGSIPKNILKGPGIIRQDIYDKVNNYLEQYITIKNDPANDHFFDIHYTGFWNHILRHILKEKGFEGKI